mgnify:CR=1 FL=1
MRGCKEIHSFSSSIEKIFHKWGQRTSKLVFNVRWEILYLQVTMLFSFIIDIISLQKMLYSFYFKNTATPHIEILFAASKNINTVNPHVPLTKVWTWLGKLTVSCLFVSQAVTSAWQQYCELNDITHVWITMISSLVG